MRKTILSISKLWVIALVYFLSYQGYAQITASVTPAALAATPAVAISGRVTDENGEGLPGVNVLLKGTSTGTTTNAEGAYAMDLPDLNGTLVFSYIGYVTQEVAVNNQSVLNVVLATDIQSLSEVVVIGYGTQKRSDITGAVAVVDTKQILQTQAASVGEQLQGRVAGVSVSSSGQPGQNPEIKIRGAGVFGNNNPLYVIDGLLTSNSPNFNPNDVESIQVLKDASATALYGAQAANGVVIITTKRGKEGPAKINFSAYYGTQNIAKRLEMMNAQEFSAITNAAYDAAGEARMPGADARANPGRYPNIDATIDTDWQDAFFKRGAIQNYNLSLSGGGKTGNYFISGDFFDQEGTVIGPRFDRYSFRVNTGFTRGRLTVGENLSLSRTNRVDLQGRPFNDVIRMLPTIPLYDANNPGGYGFGSQDNYTFGSNPVAMQRLTDNEHIVNQLQGTVFGEFAIFDFLKYRLNLGLEYQGRYDKYFRKFGNWSYNQPLESPFLDELRGEWYSTLVENTLTFNRSFGKHNLNLLGGYIEQQVHFANTGGIYRGYDVFGGEYYQVFGAGTQNPSVRGERFNNSLRRFIGRVQYDYANRYYFTASVSRDGTSNLGQKWGTFPATSVGWRVSNEDFFESVAPDWLSNVMLRGSYGVTGNSNTEGNINLNNPNDPNRIPFGGAYPYQAFINISMPYPLGTTQTLQTGASQRQLVNADIKWQSKRVADVGLDLGLLNDRILLTADYYETVTSDLLVQVPLPGTSGNAGGDPYVNSGKMRNRGVEVALTYQETQKSFNYSITGNLTTVRNKILDLPAGRPIFGPGSTRTAIGSELGEFFLLHNTGIFQNQAEIDASAQRDAKPGDVRFEDNNGRDANNNLTGQPDGKIDNDDRKYVGSSIPKLEYGLNLSGSFKGFDLTAFFAGVYGNKIFNTGKWWGYRTDDNQNHPKDLVPWTAPGVPFNAPRAVYRTGGVSNSRYNQDTWLESGSFFRLRNIQLGYTLPAAVLQGVKGLNEASLRVYVSGQNLFTITNYSGFNPEVRGEGLFGRGVDDGNFPTSRTITGGIQFGF